VLNGTIPSGISDTGASSSCAPPTEAALIHTNQRSLKRFQVPTGEIIPATSEALLHHKLRGDARKVAVVPGIKTNTLLSTGKMADENYIAIYDKHECNIYDGNTTNITVSNKEVLKGYRCPTSGHWRIPLRPVPKSHNHYFHSTPTPKTTATQHKRTVLLDRPSPYDAIANVYELPSTKQTVRYLHAAAGFPTKNTWLAGIRAGSYATWPAISQNTVSKHFPESDETQQGHMKQTPQGVRSTKPVETPDSTIEPNKKYSDIFIKVVDHRETIYTDQTGALPIISRTGNRYQMVLCEIDSNSILVEPLRNRTEGELMKTYQKLVDRLKSYGIIPKHHILDNEASEDFKATILSNGMDYQLVPPHIHRRNIAERAIQTWKDHFIAIMSGVDQTFPKNMWDLLIPQAELTLNLLRQSNVTPKISAYAHLHGPFEYNNHPLAPMGTAVQMHEKPSQRKTWAPHSVDGWYVGTSLEHYRAHKIRHKATKAERVSDTVFIKHKYLTNPAVTPADAVIAAAQQLTQALRSRHSNHHPQWEALNKLAQQFTKQAEEDTEKWNQPA
jgi:hypothetical protein